MPTMFEIEAHLRARLEGWALVHAKQQVAIWWMDAGNPQPALWLLETDQLSAEARHWVLRRLKEAHRAKPTRKKVGRKLRPSDRVGDWMIAVTIEDRLQNRETPFGYETSMRTFDRPHGWGGVKLKRSQASTIHSEWVAMVRADARVKGLDPETHRRTVLEIHKECMMELRVTPFLGGAEPCCFVLNSPKQPWLVGRGPR
jgi:hypothetical protein